MKKLVVILALVMISSVSSAADGKPDVKEIYDGWDVDKIYVMTDIERGKWCYIVRDTGRVGLQCFDIKEGDK
jgi:hypothetical protein